MRAGGGADGRDRRSGNCSSVPTGNADGSSSKRTGLNRTEGHDDHFRAPLGGMPPRAILSLPHRWETKPESTKNSRYKGHAPSWPSEGSSPPFCRARGPRADSETTAGGPPALQLVRKEKVAVASCATALHAPISPNEPDSNFEANCHNSCIHWRLHQKKRHHKSGSFRRNACFQSPCSRVVRRGSAFACRSPKSLNS